MSESDIALPERIHPSLWRASQLSRFQGRCADTGFALLSAELPGGGWSLNMLHAPTQDDMLTVKL